MMVTLRSFFFLTAFDEFGAVAEAVNLVEANSLSNLFHYFNGLEVLPVLEDF